MPHGTIVADPHTDCTFLVIDPCHRRFLSYAPFSALWPFFVVLGFAVNTTVGFAGWIGTVFEPHQFRRTDSSS